MPSQEQVSNGQQCQGTIVGAATTVIIAHVLCTADVVAITLQGKEQATCQGTIVHAVAAFCCCTLLDTPLQSLRSRVMARTAQRCQGTSVRTATTLVVAPIISAAAIVAATEEVKEWPTMPRHCCPLCRHLSALPPLSLSCEQVKDGRQCQQSTSTVVIAHRRSHC
jgi:hypothetical protein